VADAGWSLVSGRAALEDRAVVLAGDPAGFAAGLEAVAAGVSAAGVIQGRVPDGGAGKVAFVFAGQGSQRAGMGRVLARTFRVFADAVAEVCGLLDPLLGRPMAEVVFAGPGSAAAGAVDQTVFTQAGLFAVQVGLARLLGSWGIVPDYVTGHSIGEIAAAHVAGVLSLEDACTLVAARGRLMQELGGGGAMAAVAASYAEVTAMLDGADAQIAAVNGPGSVVVSGAADEVAAVARFWRSQGTRVRRLRTSHAFHSPLVEPMLGRFAEMADGLTFSAPQIPVVCGLTGQPDPELITTPGYWVRQAREAVRFADCVRWLAGAGAGIFAELGGDGTLSALGPAILAADDGTDQGMWAPVLRAGRAETMAVLTAAAQMFVRGVPVDWAEAFVGSGARWVALPTYAFQRQRYWPVLAPGGEGLPVAGGDGAEAGFWAAVERHDVQALAGVVGVRGDEPLSAVLPALAAWRRRRRQESVVDRWRYRVAWEPVAGLADGAVLAGRWLLVVPAGLAGDGLAAACEEVLAGGGAQVVTVTAEAAELDREVLTGLLGRAVATAAGDEGPGGGLAGVVSLLALADGERAGVAATLVLVQALGDAGIGGRLWVLTSGAMAVGQVSVAQAMVWGLGRVVALEYPDRWGGLVDMPAAITGRAAESLRAVLAGASGEDQVAIRQSGVLARRLVRVPAATVGQPWRPTGPVLVTGATGALGPLIVRWLAGRGAPRVVLSSRRGMTAAGTAALAARVCGQGTAVTVAACDVADRADLARLLARLTAAGTAVRGVIHAAATIKLATLEQLSLAGLDEVCTGKAAGAVNLDELLGGSVDTFVLFSSIAAIWGGRDHAAYAAANAALDALAEDRRARGLAATSVAWGPWQGDGMAEREEEQRAGRRRGLRAMPPGLAITALGQILDHGETCTTVADMDWHQFVPAFTILRPSPLLSGVAEAREAMEADEPEPEPGRGVLAGRLAGLSAAEQERLVLDVVRQEAAAVLGHASAGAVRPGAVFRDLGFDSLAAIELRDRLAAVTGLRLPATLVFDYPSPRVLAGWLRAETIQEEMKMTVPVLAGLDELENDLSAADVDQDTGTRITLRLEALLSKWKSRQEPAASNAVVEKLQSATPEEVLQFIDNELRVP
jgi:acyl transferase domain-containing protein/acyl carrier protein